MDRQRSFAVYALFRPRFVPWVKVRGTPGGTRSRTAGGTAMPAGTLIERTSTDPQVLDRMGFDLQSLRSLRARVRSVEFHLEQMGFDVARLDFYRWLVRSGHDPEIRGGTCV